MRWYRWRWSRSVGLRGASPSSWLYHTLRGDWVMKRYYFVDNRKFTVSGVGTDTMIESRVEYVQSTYIELNCIKLSSSVGASTYGRNNTDEAQLASFVQK